MDAGHAWTLEEVEYKWWQWFLWWKPKYRKVTHAPTVAELRAYEVGLHG